MRPVLASRLVAVLLSPEHKALPLPPAETAPALHKIYWGGPRHFSEQALERRVGAPKKQKQKRVQSKYLQLEPAEATRIDRSAILFALTCGL